ncbi:unnamed protein product [Leuciscus chuanchicus]
MAMTSTKKGSTDLDAGDQSLTRVKHGTVSDYSLGPQPKLHAICKENMAFNSSSQGWVPVPVLKADLKKVNMGQTPDNMSSTGSRLVESGKTQVVSLVARRQHAIGAHA